MTARCSGLLSPVRLIGLDSVLRLFGRGAVPLSVETCVLMMMCGRSESATLVITVPELLSAIASGKFAVGSCVTVSGMCGFLVVCVNMNSAVLVGMCVVTVGLRLMAIASAFMLVVGVGVGGMLVDLLAMGVVTSVGVLVGLGLEFVLVLLFFSCRWVRATRLVIVAVILSLGLSSLESCAYAETVGLNLFVRVRVTLRSYRLCRRLGVTLSVCVSRVPGLLVSE